MRDKNMPCLVFMNVRKLLRRKSSSTESSRIWKTRSATGRLPGARQLQTQILRPAETIPRILLSHLWFWSIPQLLDDYDDHDIGTKTRGINRHVSGRYCIRDMTQYQTLPTAYSGPNVMEFFCEHDMTDSEKVSQILREQKPITPLSPQELAQYRAATVCANCNKTFTHRNYKVRHHYHLTGDSFGACSNCNLQLKPQKIKI